MYTGIVQGTVEIVEKNVSPGLVRFTVQASTDLIDGLEPSMSISIDGVCMTVSMVEDTRIAFDAMQETLDKTTLGDKEVGDWLNFERSARSGDEIGGHVMSGHVMDMATVVGKDTPENNCIFTLKVNPKLMKYIFQKGFIGLNGCSLTVVDPDPKEGTFQVWLIPETLELTTYGSLELGDRVNVELDAMTQTIVETVERVMGERET